MSFKVLHYHYICGPKIFIFSCVRTKSCIHHGCVLPTKDRYHTYNYAKLDGTHLTYKDP